MTISGGVDEDFYKSTILGDAPLTGHSVATFGQSFTEALVRLVSAFMGVTPEPGILLEKLAVGNWDKIQEVGTTAAEKGWPVVLELMKQGRSIAERVIDVLVDGPLKVIAGAGATDRGDPWKSISTPLLIQTGLGLGASLLAGASNISIAGFSLGGLENLAGLLGKMAGWDNVFDGIQGSLYDALIKKPFRYHWNTKLTPELPGLGDMLRLRGKRLLPGCPDPGTVGSLGTEEGAETLAAGYERFIEFMAYLGYDADWAQVYERDLYTSPSHRELAVMGLTPNIPETWWWNKLRKRQYNERDAGYMREGLQRKLAGTWLTGWLNECIANYVGGWCDAQYLQDQLDAAGASDLTCEYLTAIAESKRARANREDAANAAVADFNVDRLNEQELRTTLGALYADDQAAENKIRLAVSRKFKKVYWLTDTQRAAEVAKASRALYVHGLLTEPEYLGRLIEGGMYRELAEITVAGDRIQRENALASQWRAWKLPALRDEVLHGLITLDTYRSTLTAGGFPAQYLDLEVAATRIALADRLTGRVQRYQLPAYKDAYVAGLVDANYLEAKLNAAGLTAVEVSATMGELTRQRQAAGNKIRANIAKQEAADQARAERYAAQTQARWEQARAEAEGMTTKWAQTKSAEAKAAAAELAKSLIAEVNKGTGANTNTLATLTAQLTNALWWATVQTGV